MRGLVLLLAALVPLTTGCFVSLGAPALFQRDRPLEETTVEGEGGDKILLVDVSEVITDTPTRRAFGLVEQESTLARVQSELKRATDDDRVRALVLRINSPGGGATASDQIYAEVVRFKNERRLPVVAALGDIAASGGYYIACAGDRIVAHPTTVTGSIGVILMNFNLEGLLGKVGVRNETYKAGSHKDLLSPFRGATPEERRIIQAVLDTMHRRFIAVVRESRPGLDPARVPELTDGRIFDAPQAVAAGLVDEIGDLRQAITLAQRAAGLEEARVVMYHRSSEARENIYSAVAGLPAQVNVMPIDLGALAERGPRFMYLWAPGLGAGL
jgi:protease-4